MLTDGEMPKAEIERKICTPKRQTQSCTNLTETENTHKRAETETHTLIEQSMTHM